MKLLITGGTGLVGSRVIELLPNYTWIDASNQNIDITDKDTITTWFETHAKDADWLIHMAAYTNVTEAEKQQGDKQGVCYQLNVVATQTLTQLCKQFKIPILYISTGFVYPATKFEDYTEADDTGPRNWYGQTKLLGEQAIINANIDYTIIRIDFPYRNKFTDKSDWAQTIKSKLDDGTLYPMFADQWFTPTWVDDIAMAINAVITNQPANTVFNVVGDTQTNWQDAAKMIAERTGHDPSTIKAGSLTKYQQQNPLAKKIIPNSLKLSNQKFTNAYAFKFHDLAQGLDAIFR